MNNFDKINILYEELQEEILRDIARRIMSTEEKLGVPDMTESARWQINLMQESGVLYNDIIERVSKYNNLSQKEIAEIFKKNNIEEYAEYSKTFKGTKLVQQRTAIMNRLTAMSIKKTINEINNLTRTTALDTNQTFIKHMNKAYMEVATGNKSYDTVIRQTIKKLAQESGKVVYPTGHKSNIEVAVRRAILTQTNHLSGEIAIENAEELGTNLMELSAHSGARPSHAEWQGKIVALDGNTKGGKYLTLSDIGYGTPGGFKGCNCRHDWYPYFEGAKKSYTKKELKEINEKTIKVGDKEISVYQAKQIQRKLERDIRDAKREFIMYDELVKEKGAKSAYVEDYILAKAKMDNAQRRLSRYLEVTKFQRDSIRADIGKKGVKGQITRTKIDYNQFKKYSNILNDSPYMPKKLEDFTDIKYNENRSTWNKLKREKKTINNINIYNKEKQRDKNTYYMFRKEGVEITNHASEHFSDRMYSGDGRQLYTFEDILETYKQSVNYYDPIENRNIKYYNKIVIIEEIKTKEVVTIRYGDVSKKWIKL